MHRLYRLMSGALLFTASTVGVGTASADPYALSATINVGPLTSFDISFVANRGIYYFADRSSASIQIINGANFQVLGQAGGFAGLGGNHLGLGP